MTVNEQSASGSLGKGVDLPKKSTRPYSLGEEIANAITHGLGVALSIAALVLLIAAAARTNNPYQLASAITYGVTLILLYLASTLYHSIPNPRARRVLKVIDHSAIYLLIAGTYTPFTLVTIRDTGGWWLFGIIWVLAVAGVSLEAFWVYRPKWVSAVVYLGMGWLVVVAMNPLLANLPSAGFWLLVAGGLAYTLGTVFYVLKRVPYTHMVWHLFVIAGSVCHFLAVVLFVLQ
ncbi:MAG: hemolysin III family protein [Coriobacteriia bacterium]|nr:hemolysin III family protein [Coriobacteriia bacterium]